jgi:tetratricopeptide (TPR) repeat protein
VVYVEQGRQQAAFNHHAEALALFRELGYRGSQGTALGWLGEIDHAMSQLDRAVDHANAALAIQREVGDRGGEADTLRTLAGISRDTGRLSHAFELATRAAALACDTGERRLQADALNTLATIEDRLTIARRFYELCCCINAGGDRTRRSLWTKPQRRLGRLHGLIDHGQDLGGQGVQIHLVT